MTFSEWWEKHIAAGFQDGDVRRGVAKLAWEAATKQAAETARAQSVRYTCKSKKAICRAIGDTIEAQSHQ